MNEVERFGFTPGNGDHPPRGMERSETGGWCRYADVATLQKDRDIWKSRAEGHEQNYLEMLKRVDALAKERDCANRQVDIWKGVADKSQDIAAKRAETLNDIADILELPTGAEDKDIVEAVRKMVPPTAEGEP